MVKLQYILVALISAIQPMSRTMAIESAADGSKHGVK